MKKHLRILYGCDDRYELTTNTVKICRPYFDSIRIVNTGPEEFKYKLQQGVGNDVLVDQFKQFFEFESCRRAQIRDVPWDDWVMWLDADETPSYKLLLKLNEITEYVEKEGCTLVKFYWSTHIDGIYYPSSTKIPSNMKEFCSWNNVFAPHRYIKKKRGIKVSSAFGTHEQIENINEKWIYMPYEVHHYKSSLQYCQSVSFSGFSNPTSHVDCNIPVSELINTKEYQALKLFQKKHRIFTANDIVRKLKIEKDEVFKKELKELFMSFPSVEGKLEFKHSDRMVTYKHMRRFAEEYDLDVNSPYYLCGKECCKYGDVQL